MTARFSFTKPLLDALPKPEAGQRTIYHDKHIRAAGLQLRVTSTSKTFFIQRRVNGAPERVTIGRYPDMTPEQARKWEKRFARIQRFWLPPPPGDSRDFSPSAKEK